jgi:hypothetical protein
VFQIQLFIRFCLCYLISVDQQDLVLGGFLFLSFGPLADSSLVYYCFGLSVDFIYSVYPCSVEISRGSILILWSVYTLFTICPFETKMGSIC